MKTDGIKESFDELERGEEIEYKSKNKKGNSMLWKVILSLLVIFGSICCGFYFFNTQNVTTIKTGYVNKEMTKEEFIKSLEVKRPATEKGKRLKAIDKIMRPKSIAIYGASNKKGSIGSDLLAILHKNGYKGDIYPINPKGGELDGLKVYKKITDVKEEVELAIIVVNVKFVLDSIDECHKKGIKAIVLITAGFNEIGGKGTDLENQLKAKLDKYGMRAVGPNGMGIINEEINMGACFDQAYPPHGGIGFVSQSGALGSLFFTFLDSYKLGISQFVSIGNQVDLYIEDFVEYWEDDDAVKQIMIYSEEIADPRRFLQNAYRASKKKPIFVLKGGRFEEGVRAASKHTGSVAGNNKAATALFEQSGALREITLKGLFNSLKAFQYHPYPKGNRAAIITAGGGAGIITTDAVVDNGFKLAKFTEKTTNALKSFLLPIASVMNPVDMVASATIANFEKAIDACVNDPNVDIVFVINVRLRIDPIEIAKAVIKKKKQYPDKCITGIFAFEDDFYLRLSKLDLNMPFFNYPEEGAEAMQKLLKYQKWLERPEGQIPKLSKIKESQAKEILSGSKLDEEKTLNLLESYGLETINKNEITYKTPQFIIKVEKDVDYGHLIKFGIGGIYDNALEDEVYRLVPIKDVDAKDMIKSLKSYKLLNSSEFKANLSQIEECLLRVSQLITDFNKISELTINPFVISEKDGKGYVGGAKIKIN